MNEALGWTLFHFLWEGAAFALLLAILMLATSSPRVRYAAACLAMLGMLCAFGVTFAVNLPKAATVAAVHVPAGRLDTPVPELSGALAPRSPALPYTYVVPIWICGVALLSLHRLMAFAAASRLRRVGVCAAPAPWPERLRSLASRLGVRRPVALLESCLAEVPAAAGYLRPAILLPVGMLAGLPAAQVELILLHELAHILRRDYLVNLLQSAVEALLFYHPAVWWVSNVIRAEREHCCDDIVVAFAGDARAYAAALVTLEQNRVPEPALAANGGSLTRRVRRLLRQPDASQSIGGPLAAAALVLLMVGIGLAAAQPEQIALPRPLLAHPPAPPLLAQTQQILARPANLVAQAVTPATQGLQGPYRKWLTDDVAYIITDSERQQYKQLPTDAAREKFIEDFWLRRDPTPGTVENESKIEHYRRIAYANDHFSAAIPGWKTDRGRVYITYGPPDQIEDHSNPTAGAVPSQQWQYKWIDGIGNNVIVEFVDPDRTGEYRMTADPSAADALRRLNTPPAPVNQDDAARLAELQKTYKDTYPAIVNLKKKIADDQAATNHFVSHEPGGKVTVTVLRGVVSISIPTASTGTFDIAGSATTRSGVVNASFRDRVTGQRAPFTLHLSPGAYTLKVTVRNLDSGETTQETVDLFVN